MLQINDGTPSKKACPNSKHHRCKPKTIWDLIHPNSPNPYPDSSPMSPDMVDEKIPDSLSPSKKKQTKSIRSKLRSARKKIGTFVLNNTRKRIQLGNTLPVICSDTGECLSFGKMTNEIKTLFRGFTRFDYIFDMKQVTSGINGFIYEFNYQRKGYIANTILKSSNDKMADNLVYEYLVGMKYINKIVKRFPCFIETYGLYFYTSEDPWKRMKSNQTIDKTILKGLLLQKSVDYNKACEESNLAAILIQNIPSAKRLDERLIDEGYVFLKYELLYVLFIIYQALHSMKTQFTHYDLHYKNIMVIESTPGKWIQYIYHLPNKEILQFRCPYIPKIIDYGRAFFNTSTVSSETIYQELCKVPNCNNSDEKTCGKYNGFETLSTEDTYRKKNESQDLRLLSKKDIAINQYYGSDITMENIKNGFDMKTGKDRTLPHTETSRQTYQILEAVKYTGNYFTEEDLTENGPEYKTIANISDAYGALQNAVQNPLIQEENQTRYISENKLGDFHIYYNKDMKYIPSR